ncbi:hypothetical protein Bpfe_017575 [Biomphalaria pfeifferi]|uniref:Smr domain-containing protein n=1 Tax=Biomphalaria pfeifferi TaxID=112525 RepID=A0AAD8BFB7_BIOPF|nr:hypothetical protein Bpfe_017575 [Biomphalaria pfeifferi]
MGMVKIFKAVALAVRVCTVKFEHFLVDCRECLDLTGLFVASIFKIHECFLNSFLTKMSEISDLQHLEENVKASAPQKIDAWNVKNIEPSKKSFEKMKQSCHSENKKPSGQFENMKISDQKMKISGKSENKKPSGHSENKKPSPHSENMKISGHSENIKPLGHSEKMKMPGLSENMKISGHSEILKPLGLQNESRIYSSPGQTKQSLVPPHQLSRSLSQASLTGHFVSGNYMTRSSNGQKKKFDKWEPPHKKLDLHKKTVTEAVESFYRFTNRQLQYYKENGYKDEDKYIFVITGHCKNRPDRVARIKPEIEHILHEEQLSHFWFHNGGEVMIEFDCFELSGPMTNDQLMNRESMACNCEDELGYLSC